LQQIFLFDHLVSAGKHGWLNFESERLSSRKIDDEIELGRLLDGNLAGPQ